MAEFAETTGLEVHVSHFPPGTSKWNKIEHRLFCFISKNWAGQPLIDIETVIDLIGSTTTKQGLKVKCILDENEYPTGIKVDDEEYDRVDIDRIDPILTGPYRGSDAFWEVKRLIRKDKKRLNAMAEVEKQEMPFVIAELLREQAITEEDLAQFSLGLRERVKEICSIEACQKDSPC